MFKISTKSQYGLRALVYLAKQKKICSLREISKNENIPFDYLEKIFLKLERAKLIKSKKGVQGGYFLAKKPSKIKIGEIIKLLEKEFSLVKCIENFCPREKNCLVKNFWKKIQKIFVSALASVTLSDLIKKTK
jgi:Rrf2 family cysteine metabolism transcriptional repressor